MGRRTVTVKDVAERYNVSKKAVRCYLVRHDHDMARVIAFYEDKERRRKAREEKAMRRAEKKILKILGY